MHLVVTKWYIYSLRQHLSETMSTIGRIVIETGGRRETIPVITATPTRTSTVSIREMRTLVAAATPLKPIG